MLPRRLTFVAAVTAALLLASATDAARSKSLASRFLDPHNAARRAVGLRPLKWDVRLAAYARRYAAARSRDCALVHSHGPYGENLFRGSGGTGWRPAAVVGAWVRERALYDPASNSCRGGGRGACGHYTQIVWRRTTAVGCALVPCGGGRGTFGVCSYNPPGNYVGMRPY
ncbi:pathogenesis-related protein PR-1-like [Phragmites australis]|uniref:pathogenesis-related protein PR-1-like n=1 Tax=Phragmites australis TaxID=29695 RepID=UPI002D7A2486|nr:pathogenesis-related protein PR-1-like [Phragmites australis]